LGEKTKEIRILRIHLEEDAGKSIHDEDYVESDATLIDLNRCGTPLIEIVSKPDFRSANEATDYLTKLRQLVRYLNICDGNMEQGSLRCDANVSVRQKKDSKLGEKTELKNMNSIRNVEKAIDFEIGRQIKVIESGAKVKQQTLLWDADKKKTKLMRSKEEAHDYRYFPEPDLAPVEIKQNWIKKIKSEMPELPNKKFSRFIADYKLSQYETKILTADIDFAEYFEKTLKIVSDPKLVAKWMLGEVLRILNDKKLKISDFTILPEKLANLLKMIKNNVIGESAAKKVFEQMLDSSDDVAVIIKKMNLVQVSDKEFIERLIDNVLTKYSKEVELYKSGKTKLFGFFMGQLMKESGGKANPKVVSDQLRKKLAH